MNDYIADLKKKCKQADVDEKVELERFLNYTINFGKYKGKTYHDVFINDVNYFHYVINNMKKDTKTYKVLSVLL